MDLSIKSDGPDVVGEILLIPVDQIDRSNRLRPIDDAWAAALGGIMLAEGQKTNVEVCRLPGQSRYTLVTGGHRHAGAEFVGMTHLRAELVTADAAERKLREVSENLHRRDLAPLDRATFIAELAELHRLRAGLSSGQDGRVASANARWQKALSDEADDAKVTMTLAYGWNDALAEHLGFSPATIKRDLLLVRRLAPSVIEALRKADHPILTNAAQLRALAQLDGFEQANATQRLLDGAKTVAEAKGEAAQAKPDEKRLNSFLGAFGRMGVTEKKGALEQLVPMLPAGWSLSDKDAPSSPAQMKAALQTAFHVIINLQAGEGVDDEELEEVRKAIQFTLFGLPLQGADA